MGRKSKLTEKQWAKVRERVLGGEKVASLAREYGVAPSTMREKISVETETVKSLAKQIVETEQRKNNLPLSVVVQAISLADKMMAIQNDLSDAAVAGARTAKRINEAAQNHAENKTDAEIMGEEGVKAMMAASMVANTAGKIGMDLLTLASRVSNGLSDAEIATMSVEQIEERLRKG